MIYFLSAINNYTVQQYLFATFIDAVILIMKSIIILPRSVHICYDIDIRLLD